MNSTMFRSKPIGLPLAGTIVALALTVAGCAASDDAPNSNRASATQDSVDQNVNDVSPEIDNDDNGVDDKDADDRALSVTERQSAEKAALEAVGAGTVTSVEASDDPGVAYDVDVRTDQGVEWDVDLDAKFAVVSKTKDH